MKALPLVFLFGAVAVVLACCGLLTPEQQAAAIDAGVAAVPDVIDAVTAPGGFDWGRLAEVGGGVIAAIAGSVFAVNKVRGSITNRRGTAPTGTP